MARASPDRLSLSTLKCARAPALMSAAKRPRSWKAWKASAASFAPSRRCRRIRAVRQADRHQQRAVARHRSGDHGQGRGVLQKLRHGPLARHHADPARRQSQIRRPVRNARSASRSANWSTISAAACFTGRPVRAVQVGGPLGAYFPRALFDTPFDYEAFAKKDGLIGHGGIVVFDDTVDMAKQARFAMEFCAIESCGKCTPCRIGSTRGVEIDRPHHHRRRPRREPRAAGRPLQHDEIRIAVRARWLHALSGDERADPFPARLRRRAAPLQAAE